jgi:hypothetical protein
MKDWKFEGDMVGKAFNNHIRQQLPFYDLLTQSVVFLVKSYLPQGGLVRVLTEN